MQAFHRIGRRRQFPPLAVIGCGGVASDRHLPALARLGWRPELLIDPQAERALALARRWNVRRVAEDVAELRPGEIEAALVATNPASHASVSLPLLENGVHLFVEKPLASSWRDCQAMLKAAAIHWVCLAVGHMRRFLFVNRWVKALLDRGALGEITGFDVREGTNCHLPTGGRLAVVRAAAGTGLHSPALWNRESAGGGVLLDTGAHSLDTLLWWLGEARVLGCRDDALGGVECNALVEIALPNGATGMVELSRTRTLRNTAIVTGRRGAIEVSLHRNAIISAHPEDLADFKLEGRPGARMPNERLHEDMFKRELQDWLGAIRTAGQPFVTGASAAAAIQAIDHAYRHRRPLHRPWAVHGRGASGGHLQGRRVLVTGASGFIGGQLVEKLILDEGAKVRAAIRNFRHAARVARFAADTVELRRFDMAAGRNGAMDGIHRLVDGCDVLFHLARDIHSPQANEAGIRALAEACGRAGARLVYVSSLSVYEPLPDAPLTEASPMGQQPDNDKFRAQLELMRLIREGVVEATIMQPTIVYGPFSGHWTDRPADMLMDGAVILPAPGDGICNALYVDDLVQALILAAGRDEALGERFLISGPEHPTWLDFHRAYEQALGRDGAIRLMARDEMARRNRRANGLLPFPAAQRLLGRRPLRRALRFASHRWLSERGQAALRRFREQGRWAAARNAAEPREFLPSARLVELYAAKCPVQLDKARRLLGYEPEFGLERGMERTVRYLKWRAAN